MNMKNMYSSARCIWLKGVDIVLNGDITIFHRSFSKAVLLGITGVILLYVSVAGIISVSVPWGDLSDTQYHIDYVWKVYNGGLPNFNDGITYSPLVRGGNFHATASHPPLFYMIHAPILGPLLNEGRWKEAIAVGRVINILLGVLCILALAWAGWVFGGAKRTLMAVAVPAIGTLMYRFTTLNTIFGNDVLIVLFATLALIFVYKLLKNGLQPKYIVALGLVSVFGMATKATYIVILGISLLAVTVAFILHGKGGLRRRTIYGALISFLIAIVVTLSIGWFYYRNYQSSGSWFKSSPDDYTGGRVYKSLQDVFRGIKLWELLYTNSSPAPYISTAITSMAVSGFITLKFKTIRSFYKKDRARLIMIIFMILVFIGLFITQIRLAVGYGSINFRYLLPALLPISLFLSYGLLQFKPVRGQLVSLAAITMGLMALLPFTSSSVIGKLLLSVKDTKGYFGKIFMASFNNGVPRIVTLLLFAFFIVGSTLLVISLFKLSGIKKQSLTKITV
ncbi:MAG: hypothetical protein WA087_04230 [Candidatus Saccharimonadales bacterium]